METLPKVLSKPNSKKSHTNPTHSNSLSIFTTLQDEKTCINTHYAILTHIWKKTNRLQFYDTIIPTTITIINIKNDLKQIIQTHYKQHNINNTISDFQRNFCINDTLCTIRQNKLTLRL